jgi:hypothetical protein
METLGIVLIATGAAGMLLFGAYALLADRLSRRQSGAIRIDERHLLETADLTPVPTRRGRKQPNSRLSDELFAELFSLRTDVASMTAEVQSLRRQLDEQA